MADSVKLPGVGPVSKKWLIIVAAGSAASIGYLAWRRRQSAAAAAPAGTSAADASGQIDPLTGDVAGSEQDQLDLAALQDESGTGLGLGGEPVSGVFAPAASIVPGAGGFATNAEWAQQAEADLGALGISQTALAAALGHYLTGAALAPDEQGLVDQARALEGDPPVSGPGGFPPAMRTTPASTGTPAPAPAPSPGHQVSVPDVTGQQVNTAIANLRKAGLGSHLSMTRDPRRTYVVFSQTPGAGTQVPAGYTVRLGIRQHNFPGE